LGGLLSQNALTFIIGPGGHVRTETQQPVVEPGTLPARLFDQTEVWVTPDGYQHRIDEFDADFCYWIINYLLTYARRFRNQWSAELRESFDTEQKAREWMIRRPAVRAFMAQVLKQEEATDSRACATAVSLVSAGTASRCQPRPAVDEAFKRLREHFDRTGRKDAYGTGRGQWIKREPTEAVYAEHLAGEGPGSASRRCATTHRDVRPSTWTSPTSRPLARCRTTSPASSFIERSRSGNAHVWVFFDSPVEAWLPRGILREATAAVGKPGVEVFPKQDKLREGMVGNYINLPYHGEERPILES
jgi:hypothetical protein